LGKYVNDAPRRQANAYTKVVNIDGIPRVIIIAQMDSAMRKFAMIMEFPMHHGEK